MSKLQERGCGGTCGVAIVERDGGHVGRRADRPRHNEWNPIVAEQLIDRGIAAVAGEDDALHPALDQRTYDLALQMLVVIGVCDEQTSARGLQAVLHGFRKGRINRIRERGHQQTDEAGAPGGEPRSARVGNIVMLRHELENAGARFRRNGLRLPQGTAHGCYADAGLARDLAQRRRRLRFVLRGAR